jgi:hypothetical protein
MNGKVTKDVERTIGGYYALQLDYTIPVNSMIGKMTYIVFFTDDCAFTVVYGSDNDDEKSCDGRTLSDIVLNGRKDEVVIKEQNSGCKNKAFRKEACL